MKVYMCQCGGTGHISSKSLIAWFTTFKYVNVWYVGLHLHSHPRPNHYRGESGPGNDKKKASLKLWIETKPTSQTCCYDILKCHSVSFMWRPDTVPTRNGKCLTCLPFWAIATKGPTSPSQSRASKGTQLSPGFIYLIQFSGPNVRGCHGLALDFHDMRVVAGPPSSEQNSLRTALNSCLGKGLCSLTKGFQSSPQGGAIPHHYHCVRFACSLVGSFGCLLGAMRTGKGTSIPVGS